MTYELAYLIADELKGEGYKLAGSDAHAEGLRAGLFYCAQMFLRGCVNYEDVLDTIGIIGRMEKNAVADSKKSGYREYEVEYTLGLADAYSAACTIASEIIAENEGNLDDFIGE